MSDWERCVSLFDDVGRDIESIVLPQRGALRRAAGAVPWLVDDACALVAPVRVFLTDFVARDNSPKSLRSYVFGLLRWWRWLHAVGVDWDKATPIEGRDLVLWLKQTSKPGNVPRTKSRTTAGTINLITHKRYLDDKYAIRTIRHSNAVVRSFYEFWIERGEGPLINPIPLDPKRGHPHAHHNPMLPFRPEGRIRYNPKLPKQHPREIPEERWRDLFTLLRSNRDRALLPLVVSNGARAQEILDIRDRLLEIIASLRCRIDEARANGWTGEVEGLKVSLNAAAAKFVSLDKIRRGDGENHSRITELGIPVISDSSS